MFSVCFFYWFPSVLITSCCVFCPECVLLSGWPVNGARWKYNQVFMLHVYLGGLSSDGFRVSCRRSSDVFAFYWGGPILGPMQFHHGGRGLGLPWHGWLFGPSHPLVFCCLDTIFTPSHPRGIDIYQKTKTEWQKCWDVSDTTNRLLIIC